MENLISAYNLTKHPGLHAQALKTVYWFITGSDRSYLYDTPLTRLISKPFPADHIVASMDARYTDPRYLGVMTRD